MLSASPHLQWYFPSHSYCDIEYIFLLSDKRQENFSGKNIPLYEIIHMDLSKYIYIFQPASWRNVFLSTYYSVEQLGIQRSKIAQLSGGSRFPRGGGANHKGIGAKLL